jgi:hypothetical protein
MYFMRGICPKDWKVKNAIQSPPCSGYGLAVVLYGAKTSIVFSPVTLESWVVPNSGCCEMDTAKWFSDLVDIDFSDVAKVVKNTWLRLVKHQLPGDFDLAASILRRLGHEPPCETPAAVAVGLGKISKGGKDPETETKPIKRGLKRAQVAEFFMNTASIKEAANILGVTRSGVMSHLRDIHKCNGFGYEVIGDAARLLIPDGHKLFDGEEA